MAFLNTFLTYLGIKEKQILNSKIYNHISANKIIFISHPWYSKGKFHYQSYKLPKWIGASLSYTAMHRSFINLGGGISLNLGPLQIYAISDNLSALFNLAKITGGGIVPQTAKTLHTRIGVNFVF